MIHEKSPVIKNEDVEQKHENKETPSESVIHEKSPVIKNETIEQKHENFYCKSCNRKMDSEKELKIHEKFIHNLI